MPNDTPYIVLQHEDPVATRNAFIADVCNGLQGNPKTLPSRYFYDTEGSRLFERITMLPEYYITRAETQVLRMHATAISDHVNGGRSNIIELGAGCGEKTRMFLDRLLMDGREFTYMPIDISKSAMQGLSKSLKKWFGNDAPPMRGVVGEYFQALDWIERNTEKNDKNIVLFFGSNIGNEPDGVAFMKKLRNSLRTNDQLLIGFDRKKNLKIVHRAYDDISYITWRFNLNVLLRINRELGGEFDVNAFVHHPYYDPQIGGMVSWIVSTKQQDVRIRDLDQTFSFDEWEGIRTEYSLKYSLSDIESLAKGSGFQVVEHFSDNENIFTDSLWTI